MTAEIVTQSSLADLERVIERGVQTFVEVGLALMEVRDRKLYEDAGYVNFEMYCHGRWRFSRRYSYNLIEAAETVQALQGDDDVRHGAQILESVHVNERQVRELAPLAKKDPEAARAVLRDVSSQNQHVTAAKIKEAVREHFADETDDDDEGWEPDPRIDELKSAIRILERCQRARSDVFATAFRVMAGEARKVLRDMEAREGI